MTVANVNAGLAITLFEISPVGKKLPDDLRKYIWSFLPFSTPIPRYVDSHHDLRVMEMQRANHPGLFPRPDVIAFLNVFDLAHSCLEQMRPQLSIAVLSKKTYVVSPLPSLRQQIVESIHALQYPEDTQEEPRKGAQTLSDVIHCGNYLEVLKVYFGAIPGAIWNKAKNPVTQVPGAHTILSNALAPLYTSALSTSFVRCQFELIRANGLEAIYLHKSGLEYTPVGRFKAYQTQQLQGFGGSFEKQVEYYERAAQKNPTEPHYLKRIQFLKRLQAIEALITEYNVPINEGESKAIAAKAPASVSKGRLRRPLDKPRVARASTPSAVAPAVAFAPLPSNPAPAIPIPQAIPDAILAENASSIMAVDIRVPLPTRTTSEVAMPPVVTPEPALAGRVTIESAMATSPEVKKSKGCLRAFWITISKIARIVAHTFVTLFTRCNWR